MTETVSDSPTSGPVTLVFDEFTRTSLEEQAARAGLSTSDLVQTAVAYYLGDPSAERLARRVPWFASDTAPVQPFELRVDLAPPAREPLELEAARQGVPLARLVEHAVLYFLADLSSGRVAARIIENSAG